MLLLHVPLHVTRFPFSLLHAFQVPVVQIQFVVSKMEPVPANAYPITLEIHTMDAVQNVSLVLTVPQIELAFETNARILVLVSVE